MVDALNATPRDEKFLECSAIEFVELILRIYLGGRSIVAPRVVATKSPNDTLHHLSHHVVGDRFLAHFSDFASLGNGVTLKVESEVVPLTAISEIFVSSARFTQFGASHPCIVGRLKHSLRFMLIVFVCVFIFVCFWGTKLHRG